MADTDVGDTDVGDDITELVDQIESDAEVDMEDLLADGVNQFTPGPSVAVTSLGSGEYTPVDTYDAALGSALAVDESGDIWAVSTRTYEADMSPVMASELFVDAVEQLFDDHIEGAEVVRTDDTDG